MLNLPLGLEIELEMPSLLGGGSRFRLSMGKWSG